MKVYLIIAVSLTLFISCGKKNNSSAKQDMDKMVMDKKDTMNNMPGMGNMQMGKRDSMNAMQGMDTANQNKLQLVLNAQQMRLGNIQVDTIRSGMFGDKIVFTATLNTDQKKITSVSSRVMGRIEKLYFKNLGDYVKKRDKLYDLYSEDLNNAKQEYIFTVQRKNSLNNSVIDFDQLIQSAKNKLLLWGMSEAQIKELETTKTSAPITTFYSSSSGYITLLEIKEGDYVAEGGTIVRLADLSTLWAEAQVYSSQLSEIDSKGIATVKIPDVPGMEMKGKIEFVNPEINIDTRINLIRVSIINTGNRLKPGMPAYVFLKNSEHNTISLPIDAVLRDKKGATVWIQTGPNTFTSKMVQTGLESDDRIEIKSGLQPGDVVVISGAFLLNSEYIFRNGDNSMAGMKM